MNFIGNRGGIAFVDANLTTAGTSSTEAVYTIPNHTFRWTGPYGMIVLHISTATTTATGITFMANNQSQTVTDAEGAPITNLDAGYHIAVYNKQMNTLNIIV